MLKIGRLFFVIIFKKMQNKMDQQNRATGVCLIFIVYIYCNSSFECNIDNFNVKLRYFENFFVTFLFHFSKHPELL
jgi:hypothetical protein